MVEKKKKTRSTSSSVDPATQYALDVTTGKILAGPDIYTVQLNLTPLEDLRKNSTAEKAKLLREVHNAVFPDIPFEQSPLKQAA